MNIILKVSEQVQADRATCFDLATDPARFPEFFPGNLVIPAVRAVELKGDPPPSPGMLRLVHNADETCMTERVEAFRVPEEHRYRLIDGFVPPGSWLFREAEGHWTFAESDGGTKIGWTYTFFLTHPLAALLAWPLMGVFFRAAMRRCLSAMRSELERSTAKAG